MDQLTESARQWIKYKNSLPYVPFDGNTNTKTTPFRLTIQDVDIVLPKLAEHDYNSLQFRFSITFYHTGTKRCFGTTCRSSRVKPAKFSDSTKISMETKTRFYWHTAITDPHCVALVELCCAVVEGNKVVDEFGVGWSALRLFDGSVVNKRGESQRKPNFSPIYMGTPRAVFLLEGFTDTWTLPVNGGAKLSYSVDVHIPFKAVAHLIRPNELICERDGIAGVKQENSQTCLEPPYPEESFSLIVSHVRLSITNRFEAELLSVLDNNRRMEFNIGTSEDNKCSIVGRRIILGVHNGRTFVDNPYIESFHELDGYYIHDQPLVFKKCAMSEKFCVLFQLDYIVRIPVPSKKANTTISSTERIITLGYFPFVFLSKEKFLEGDFSVELLTGSATTPTNDNSYVYHDCSGEGIVVDFQLERGITEEGIPPRELSTSMTRKSLKSNAESLVNTTTNVRASPALATVEQPPENSEMTQLPTPRPGYAVVAPNMLASTNTMSKQSRADKLLMYSMGFPSIKDHHGNSIQEHTVSNTVMDMELEKADDMQNNEVVLQFMALSSVPQSETAHTVNNLKTVFFSFQFYKYPLVVTERLRLEDFSSGTNNDVLRKETFKIVCTIDDQGKSTDQKGLTVRLIGEGSSFRYYLANKTLSIDIWDGESMLHVGTVGIELRALLRQQRSAVQLTDEFDIIKMEYDSSEPTGSHDMNILKTAIRGRLSMKLANVGHPSDPNYAEQRSTIVVQERKQIKPNEIHKEWAKRHVDKDKDLAMALAQKRVVEDIPPELFSVQAEASDVKKRKYARLQIVRQFQNKKQQKSATESRKENDKQLKLTQLYRDKSRHEVVSNKLRDYLTTIHKIYPSFGSAVFFEYVFRNPYPEEHCFTISFDDPEISYMWIKDISHSTGRLVTNANEWRYMKRIFGVATPTEEELLQGNKILLRPNEYVHVPFKFQSFNCATVSTFPFTKRNTTTSSVQLFGNTPNMEEPIKARSIFILFHNQYNLPISVVQVQVFPQPFVVDKSVHFASAENDFLKKTLLLPNRPSTTNNNKYIHCSSSSAIVNSTLSKSSSDMQEISLKYRCGAGPQITRFYILLYDDPFKVTLVETWQIFVHSLQRIDIVGMTGQTSTSPLILRGGTTSRLIQCYSSEMNELKLQPSSPVNMVAGALTEISIFYKPLQQGKKHVFIHVVDIEFHQLVSAWLVCCTANPPTITREFQVEIPTGKVVHKKLTYTNPYNHKKTLTLSTNKAQYIAFAEPKFEISSGETTTLSLSFKAAPFPGKATILVFLNDAEFDKTEDCIQISLTVQ